MGSGVDGIRAADKITAGQVTVKTSLRPGVSNGAFRPEHTQQLPDHLGILNR